jgi:hypothetical protein
MVAQEFQERLAGNEQRDARPRSLDGRGTAG